MAEIIAAAIAALAAFVAGLLVNVQDKARFFSTTVSGERMVWIKDMRVLCADLFSVCEQYDAESLPPEGYAQFLKARNGILIRMDPPGWYATDDELLSLLSDPDFAKVKANLPRIRLIMTEIIKGEWDKVKIEAGNNRWKVKKIKELQERLNREHRMNRERLNAGE